MWVNANWLKPSIAPCRTRVIKFVLLGATLASSYAASAQVLTLNNAIELTLSKHPSLASFVHQRDAAQGLVTQAGVSSPLVLSANVEDVMGSGEYRGLSAMQTTLGVSWLLERDVIDARVALANQQDSQIVVERQIAALDVAAQTANIFITILSQQEQLVLAKLEVNNAQAVLNKTIQRVRSGKQSSVDQHRAQANLATKQLLVEDLVHEIQASKSQLAAQWQGSDQFEVNGTLKNIPSAAQIDDAILRINNSPASQKFLLAKRSLQSSIALAKATQKPKWTVNAGIKRNEALDDVGLMAGVSVAFGAQERNRGKIIALEAKQRQTQSELDAWRASTSTQLLLLSHKLKHSRHVIEQLTKQVIPALTQANQQAIKAYQRGSFRYFELYTLQQELVTSQQALIDAYTNIQLFNIEFERLSGASISV